MLNYNCVAAYKILADSKVQEPGAEHLSKNNYVAVYMIFAW